MNIAWYQYDIEWLDSKANLSKITAALKECPVSCDLLVFPEMFDTGFAMKPHLIENRNQDDVVDFMKILSSQYSCGIIFSTTWKVKNEYRNRLFYIDGSQVKYYDKVHLFGLGGESDFYQSGNDRKIVTMKSGLRILPLICYDLRFPEIARNTEDIDLIVYVASWPEARTSQWDILLKARAVENQCHVLGVNRLGKDGNELNYIGHSALYAYDGKVVLNKENKSDSESEGIFQAKIDLEKQKIYRKKLPFLKDIQFIAK